jgi:hypothetical protein
MPCHEAGRRIIKRSLRLPDSQGTPRTRTLEETEWQALFALPPGFEDQKFAGYFKVPDGRVRIAVSRRTREGNVRPGGPGLFYYPLGVGRGFTGTGVSVSAPFDMDGDRSELVPPETNAWNRWLLETAADLTVELLVSDWQDRFGPDVMLALGKQAEPSVALYLDRIARHLRDKPCWPTREKERDSGRLKYAQANQITLPEHPEYDGLLTPNRYLDTRFGGSTAVRQMALECGAKTFTMNSLIRLRCAGQDKRGLQTQLGKGEAEWYYSSYPAALQDVNRQEAFARAIETYAKHLSRKNRTDLSCSATTLTASGGLHAPGDSLWAVEEAILDFCRVPASQRLHPALMPFKALRALCREFDATEWVQGVATRAAAGTASEEERLALYRYLLSPRHRLNRTTVTLLRGAPVLRDHEGRWVTPAAVIKEQATGAKELALVLHFPHPDYAGADTLARLFRFRKVITGDDLIRYAGLVGSHPERAEEFEQTLQRHLRLVTASVSNALREVPCLRSSRGGVEHPARLYLPTRPNRACLGPGAAYYERLGCMDRPRAHDIRNHLRERAVSNGAPDDPGVIYPALVEALRREHLPATSYKEEPILWLGRGYGRPDDTLIGTTYQRFFPGGVPLTGRLPEPVYQAYRSLGARVTPVEKHWRALLLWFDNRYRKNRSVQIPERERDALREAYSRLEGLPAGLPSDTLCLLDRRGFLHRVADVQTGRFVLDDEPETARAIEEHGAIDVAFADAADERTLSFYTKIGLKSVSDLRRHAGEDIGRELAAPSWFDTTALAERLHDPDLASALATLSAHELRRGRGAAVTVADRGRIGRRLAALKRVIIVGSLALR